MAKFFLLCSVLISVTGCETPVLTDSVAARPQTLVLADTHDLSQYVGTHVTIRGKVNNTKTEQIIGVDISYGGSDLNGQYAQASGVLETWTVTQKQLDQSYSQNGVFANRGPGRYYRLVQPQNHSALAIASAVKPDSD